MEKETDKSTVVLKAEENVGVVQIADDVVAMIASLAATASAPWPVTSPMSS